MLTRLLLPFMIVLMPLAGCGTSATTSQAKPNAATPGWTGRTVVVGSNSSMADNATATSDQQQWQRSRR